MFKAIHAARGKARVVVEEPRAMKLTEVAKEVEDGIEETLTYCDFPSEHWTRIRTNNVIERLNREIRRRTRIAGTFPDSNSALMLACARLRHVADTQWGNKGNFLLCQHPADGRGGTDIGDKQLVDLGDYVQQNGGGDSWSVQQAILLTTSDGDDSIT